jgi:L-lactate utilization protein LutC
MDDQFGKLATKESIEKTIKALKENGIDGQVVKTGQEAKETALALVPEGAEVMTMTSVTLETLGIVEEINNSGKYNPVKGTLSKMDRETQGDQMQKLGAAPQYSLGSVHAVTELGQLVIASNTGSQLPAYAYGSSHVIFVIGTQKIVSNLDQAMKRIYEHSLPLESQRARKAYGTDGSSVNKILVINTENISGRIHVIFVEEMLGF